MLDSSGLVLVLWRVSSGASHINKRCEWYDLELRRLMLKKDRLYKKFLSRHDQASKTRYQKIETNISI